MDVGHRNYIKTSGYISKSLDIYGINIITIQQEKRFIGIKFTCVLKCCGYTKFFDTC